MPTCIPSNVYLYTCQHFPAILTLFYRYDMEGAADIMGDDCDNFFRILDHEFQAHLCCDEFGNFDGEQCQ